MMHNETKPRIGLALGSGSARGWAHIGVIRGLEQLGIKPDIVTGTSVGSLVGAAYASHQLDGLENWVKKLSWTDILKYLDISLLEGGFIQGEKLMDFVRQHVGEYKIETLPVKFAAVATDLHTGREVWLREGDLVDSIRASIALPGLFSPVKLNDRWLVDGGLVDPVPVALCRAMGAELVIAVNLNGDIVGKHLRRNHNKQTPPASSQAEQDLWSRISSQVSSRFNKQKENLLLKLLGQNRNTPGMVDVMASAINIMQDKITRSRMAGDPPEVLLSPQLAHLGLMEFDQAEKAIAEGLRCVERMRPVLEPLVSESDPIE